MKKFYIHHGKDKTSILEVECEKVFDLFIKDLYKAMILSPKFLLDKSADGKSFKSPIFYSHSLYDSVEEVSTALKDQIKSGLERDFRKQGKEYSEEDIISSFNQVEIIML
jgi:hypothetical protein